MKIFRSAIAMACAFAAAVPAPVLASPASDALSSCLADNTTGKERKALARWVFLAISSHPEMSDISTATEGMRDEADRDTAALMNKLLTQSCPVEAGEVYQTEGANSFKNAFETLGKVAMIELMSNAQVSASISRFSKYIDSERIELVLKKPAGKQP